MVPPTLGASVLSYAYGVPRQTNTYVEFLKLEDLSRAETGALVGELRYQDAEFSEFEHTGTFPEDRSKLEPSLGIEDAVAELRRAQAEGRLRIEWKRGWLYFFYGPLAEVDMCEFLHRVPRKGGPRPRSSHY